MCSKQTEPDVPSQPPPSAGVWSITRRLTWLYLACTASLLLVAGGVLYWALRLHLDHTRHSLIASKIEVLRGLLREQPQKADVLASEVEHEASESQPLRYYIRILNEDGQPILETPGMDKLVSVAEFPSPVEVPARSRPEVEAAVRHQGDLRLVSARASVGLRGHERRTIQIAMDTTTGNQLLTDYRSKLLIVLGGGVVVAAVLGAWVARKGMQPLARITWTVQRVTASQLNERIAGEPWPAELAELAAAFDEMLDRLENSFNRLSQFSADLAHALRTPIHNLRGEAEVALARDRTPEEYQHTLASSLEECDRLTRMIDGLLFLARADDPKSAMKRIRFEARKEMEAVREFYEALASEQQVSVACEGDACLTGDPMLFRRAVSNLLGNALRHTPPRGSVHLSIASLPDRKVELVVRDTGCGIAPEHLPRVFDRLYRVGESPSQVPGGSGLGLAIVRSIMRLHGGTASIRSTVGQGTTVTLEFPGAPA
jgi:two-component system heavy metal sensor histidine kinase CusS